MCIGCGEEQLALDKVDLVSTALLSSEAHSRCCALWVCKVTADDQRVRPQVIVETKHHWVA